MFPGKEGDENNVCEFYSFCKKKIVSRTPVPEANGKRYIGVGFGWILTEAYSSGELSLVNPMSAITIQLPGYKDHINEIFLQKAVLSANPSETSDFVLMAVGFMNLGFWRNKDSNWTRIETSNNEFKNICYYKHKIYAIDFFGNVWMCDPYLTQTAEIIMSLNHRWCTELAYWVESSKGDQLLFILRDDDDSIAPKQCKNPIYFRDLEQDGNCFRTVRIDTLKREYSEISNLDGDAIFIGLNSAVSVAANDFPGMVKANCIYFPDDGSLCSALNNPRKCSSMRVHNVEDGSLGFEGLGFSLERPPQWLL